MKSSSRRRREINYKLVRFIDKNVGIPLAYLVKLCRNAAGEKYCERNRKDVSSILMMKFWGIGNTIMLLPIARALRKRYPGARLDIVTQTSNKAVVEEFGLFDRAHYIETSGVVEFLGSTNKAFKDMKRLNYDVIIDFEQFARFSALLCAFVGAGRRIGFKTAGQRRDFLYTDAVEYDNHIHMTNSFFNLVQCLGVERDESCCMAETGLGRRAEGDLRDFLDANDVRDDDRLVMIHIGTSANFSLRRWPARNFAMLADKLVDAYGVKIVISGIMEEMDLAAEMLRHVKRKDSVINTCGRLDFKQYVSLIRISDLVVSADTSAVHVASYLSVPVVGLYGPNTPVLYGPWGGRSISFYKKIFCSPCITNYNSKINICRHPEGQGACMSAITADEAFDGIKENFFNILKVSEPV